MPNIPPREAWSTDSMGMFKKNQKQHLKIQIKNLKKQNAVNIVLYQYAKSKLKIVLFGAKQ
jgi:hypothetical protein